MDFKLFSREIQDGQYVQINFTHDFNNSIQTYCAFWNTDLLQWSQEGCITRQNENGTTCECNHLTSFGILFGGTPDDTYPWEDDLTKVCGGISIACLFFTQIVLHLGNKLTRITATNFHLHTVSQ